MGITEREMQALRLLDTDFQREVLEKLSRLEAKMDMLVGNGQPGRMTIAENRILVLERNDVRRTVVERLVNAVLSRRFSPFDRSIDMHVSKVRKKLGDTENDEHIKTVRGVGYIFARPREKSKV